MKLFRKNGIWYLSRPGYRTITGSWEKMKIMLRIVELERQVLRKQPDLFHTIG